MISKTAISRGLAVFVLQRATGFCNGALQTTGDSDIMTKFARAFALLFLVLIFFLSVGFSFFNTQLVALSFGFTVLAPQPMAVWIISAFVIGGATGLALGAGLARHWRNAREIHRLRGELTRLKATMLIPGSNIKAE